MSQLADKKCLPCQGGVPPLSSDEKDNLLGQLHSDWSLTHERTRLHRSFKFDNFAQAMDLANKAGEIAESQSHHPELTVGWGHMDAEIWTHKIGDLVEADFILAAKFDLLSK